MNHSVIQFERKSDEQRLDDVDRVEQLGADRPSAVEPDQGDAERDFLDILDASRTWIVDAGSALGDVLGEDNGEGTLGLDAQFARAAANIAPKSRRRRPLETLITFTDEDFEEGAVRNAFLVVKENTQALLKQQSQAAKEGRGPVARDADIRMLRALEFFFGVLPGESGVTFQQCCDVLEVRIDVFRLRIQYEWFLKGTIFSTPFPFMTARLPAILDGPLHFYGGAAGYALAREAWVQPGISREELIGLVAELDGYSVGQCVKALEALDEQMLMSYELGWYVTGRNPLRLRLAREQSRGWNAEVGGTIHWSGLFGKTFL